MTGPEHFAEAEGVIAGAQNRDLPTDVIKAIAAVAQVHATLALAAATALSLPSTSQAWREVTS